VRRKKVLGTDPLSWITPTSLTKEEGDPNLQTSEHTNFISSKLPKFRTYEVKLTLRLREDQLEFLNKLEREIMKKRSKPNRKERITKNSILRAMIDAFSEVNIDTAEIAEESELVSRLKKVVIS